MSERLTPVISADAANGILRHVEPAQALEAGILTPMAGTRPVRLFSLEEAERFLVLHDGKAVAQGGAWAKIDYVDPEHLATWVGDVLGDQELADALRLIISSRKPYGFLVPEMKSLMAARIGQCREALGLPELASN